MIRFKPAIRAQWLTGEKVAIGVVMAWHSLTFFLLGLLVRVQWFAPDEKPDVAKTPDGAPMRQLRRPATR